MLSYTQFCTLQPDIKNRKQLKNYSLAYSTIIVTFICNNSTEHSHSWEADAHSAGQELPRHLWNSTRHYCVHKALVLGPILKKLILVNPPLSKYFKSFLTVSYHLHLLILRLHGVRIPTSLCLLHIPPSSFSLTITWTVQISTQTWIKGDPLFIKQEFPLTKLTIMRISNYNVS